MGNALKSKRSYSVNVPQKHVEKQQTTECTSVTDVTSDDVTENEFKEKFEESVPDGGLDAYQLRTLLNQRFYKGKEDSGFSTDLCRSMVASQDDDLSGQLGFEETWGLFQQLVEWKKIYGSFDKDGTGKLEATEINDILQTLDKGLPEQTVKSIVIRYTDKEGKVTFADFVACMVKLTSLIETFESTAGDSEEAEFTIDQFIQMTVYT